MVFNLSGIRYPSNHHTSSNLDTFMDIDLMDKVQSATSGLFQAQEKAVDNSSGALKVWRSLQDRMRAKARSTIKEDVQMVDYPQTFSVVSKLNMGSLKRKRTCDDALFPLPKRRAEMRNNFNFPIWNAMGTDGPGGSLEDTHSLEDKIASIHHPSMRQALEDLLELVHSKDPGLADGIVHFALEIAGRSLSAQADYCQKGEPQHGKKIAKNGMQALGRLIHLVNSDIQAAFSAIDGKRFSIARLELNVLFHGENGPITTISRKMEAQEKANIASGLQGDLQMTAATLPAEIAKVLVLDNGKINFALIPELQHAFTPQDKLKNGYRISLHRMLNTLVKNSELRDAIGEVQAPKDSKSYGNKIIRDVLDLGPHCIVSDLDAKKTVLSALLAHLRQGMVGSCFATYLGIELLAGNPMACVEDFRNLLSTGHLTRQIGDDKAEFPYLLRISNESQDHLLELNVSGLQKPKTCDDMPTQPLDAPGLQAAFTAIGLSTTNATKVLKSTMAKYFVELQKRREEEGDQHAAIAALMRFLNTGDAEDLPEQKPEGPLEPYQKISVRELFTRVAAELSSDKQNPHVHAEKILESMLFAFEGKTHHPLLRVWENAMAGMAEWQQNGVIRERVLLSAMASLTEKAAEVLPGQDEMINTILVALQERLTERIRFLYDPDFHRTGTAADDHSTDGAFVLYDSLGSTDPREWKRIDSVSRFQSFMQSIIPDVMQDLKYTTHQYKEREQMQDALEKLAAYARMDDFARDVVFIYNFGMLDYYDLQKSLNELDHTPWVDKTGNNAREVLRVYFELDDVPERYRFKAYNAEHLMTEIVEIGKKLQPNVDLLGAAHPHHLVPVMVPGVHALSLTLGDKSLARAWQSDTYTGEWIRENVIMPGREVAKAEVSPKMVDGILDYCKKRRIVKKSNFSKLEAVIRSLPSNLYIKDFRNRVLTAIRNIEGKKLRYAKRLSQRIDTQLFRLLPKDMRASLKESTCIFADTNWVLNNKDIKFGFMYSPFSNTMEIWEISDDREDFYAMDQKTWLLNHEWEFFTEMTHLIHREVAKDDPILDGPAILNIA